MVSEWSDNSFDTNDIDDDSGTGRGKATGEGSEEVLLLLEIVVQEGILLLMGEVL